MNREIARRLRLLETQITISRAWDYSRLSDGDVDFMIDVFFRRGRGEAVSHDEEIEFERLDSLIVRRGPSPILALSDDEVEAEIRMHERAWLDRRAAPIDSPRSDR